MTERPILFSGEMVMAILEGRKTQTRRIVKPNVAAKLYSSRGDREGLVCPYGKAGDRLWVRETWRIVSMSSDPHSRDKGVIYKAEEAFRDHPDYPLPIYYLTSEARNLPVSEYWHPSIFMPRWASRIVLEIVDVRADELQSLTEEEAEQEGVPPVNRPFGQPCRCKFMDLWNRLNAKRGYGWDANPWVWVITFRTVSIYGRLVREYPDE